MGARSCKLLLIGTDSGLITVGLPASGSTSFVFFKLQQIHSPVTNLPLSQDSISEDPYFCFRAIYISIVWYYSYWYHWYYYWYLPCVIQCPFITRNVCICSFSLSILYLDQNLPKYFSPGFRPSGEFCWNFRFGGWPWVGGGRSALTRQIVDSRSINLHNCQ